MSQYELDAEKFPLHAAVVQGALAEYRKHIQELPPGSHSNTSPEIKLYQEATSLGGTGWAWCAAFYDWNWKNIDHPLPYRSAGAFDLNSWAIRANWDTHTPIPGDGVCWNVGSGHYSMFLRREGSYVVTVDGNVSDAVLICKRPGSLVRGYMHVPEVAHTYKPGHKIAPVPKHLMKEKKFQIVTSVNGHRQLVISGRPMPTLLPFITKASNKHKSITIEEVPK
jgi:hypothetical protein